MTEMCASLYLDVVKVTEAGRSLQLESSKGVVNGVSTGSLDGPAAQGVGWVVVWKV